MTILRGWWPRIGGGRPFYCALGTAEGRRFLVVHFRGDDCATAAFDVDKLHTGDIAFGSNSCRGDNFAGLMEEAIKKEDKLVADAPGAFPSGFSRVMMGGKPQGKKAGVGE